MKLNCIPVVAVMVALGLGFGTDAASAEDNGTPSEEDRIIQAVEALANFSYHEAKELVEEVLAVDPDQPAAVMVLGAVYYGLKEYEKARSILERAVTLAPNNYLAYIMLGDIWHHEDLAIARGYWDKALALNPGIPELYSYAAWRIMYAGDLDGGMDYVRRGLEIFPGDRDMLLAAAFALGRAGWYEQVDEIYRSLLAHDPTDLEVVARGIMLSVITGDMETAAKGMAYLESLGGDNMFLHLANGFYRIATGEHEKAIAAYTTLLGSDLVIRDRYQVWHNLGVLHADARRWQEALDFVTRSYDLLIENPGLDNRASRWNQNALIGLFNQELGNKEEAKARFTASVEAGYGDENAFLRLASLLFLEGNGKKALEILSTARETFPDDVQLLTLTARILLNTEHPEEANQFLERIVDQGPTYPSDADAVEWAKRMLEESKE